MKANKIKNGLVVVMLAGSMALFAQPHQGRGHGQGCQGNHHGKGNHQAMMKERLNLSEEQENQMKDLRIKHMKEMQGFRNQLHEKRARLNTLQSADNADMNEINKTIEETGTLWTEMQKTRAAHLQEVRKILDDEQRVIFDAMHARKRGKGNMHHGRGMGYQPDRQAEPGDFAQAQPEEDQWEDFKE